MKNQVAVCTIVSKNYLPFARCLMECLRRWHPEFIRIVILVDKIDGYFEPEREDFEVIPSESLPIPDSKWFHFKYSILELNTAVKPYALEVIFDRYEVDKILYFDPDIWIYQPLTPLLGTLDAASIVLTPHLTASLEDEFRPTEFQVMQSGAYNLGFIALAAGMTTFRFLRWWQRKVYNDCRADTARGLFVDQRWVDLVPGLFPEVLINREPGYNVAYWNLPHRKIERSGLGYEVNGCPLYFFHFSGFDPEKPAQFSKHQNRYRLSDLGEAKRLVEDYRRELFRHGYATCKSWPYAFAAFQNGVGIPDFARSREQQSSGMLWDVRDPFSVEGFQAFVRHWNGYIADSSGHSTYITRLAYQYYLRRGDVQGVMPEVFGRDQRKFLEWWLTSGQKESAFHPVFIAPIRAAVQKLRAEAIEVKLQRLEARKRQRTTEFMSGIPADFPPVCREILSSEPLTLTAVARKKLQKNVYVTWLNGLLSQAGQPVTLTRLAYRIYKSRPDVREAFPAPFGEEGERFVRWFLTCGRLEYELTEPFLEPMRQQLHKLLPESSSSARRLRHNLRLAAMLLGARINAGRRLRHLLGSNNRAASAAAASEPAPASARPQASLARSPGEVSAPVREALLGVNLVGYARSETGVGESLRSAKLATHRSGIPVRVKSLSGDISRQQDFRIGPSDNHFPFFFNVMHVNADMTPLVAKNLGKEFFSGRYTIGYWAWELEEFPNCWLDSFQHVQEVWVPSTFCQDAIARKSPVPVIRVPHCVECETSRLGRSHFGLPPDEFLFLVLFDVLSVVQRKNPMAAVEAFKLAFGRSSNCRLVLKVNNTDKRPSVVELLREACAGLPVTLIDRVISRNEVNALIQACDCLVSLHRSEGFGFTMAEGMYLGKPVVATAYSGNMDFTRPHNSFLVNYRMVPVGKGAEPYQEDCLWADPLIPDAAQQMKLVYECPELRHRVARAGQDFVRQHLSPDAVGKLMRERLEHLSIRGRVDLINAPQPLAAAVDGT